MIVRDRNRTANAGDVGKREPVGLQKIGPVLDLVVNARRAIPRDGYARGIACDSGRETRGDKSQADATVPSRFCAERPRIVRRGKNGAEIGRPGIARGSAQWNDGPDVRRLPEGVRLRGGSSGTDKTEQ